MINLQKLLTFTKINMRFSRKRQVNALLNIDGADQ